MRTKNLIHELIPAEKRLAKIDKIDLELERRWKAKEIGLTEYVDTKQPLTVKRFKEFRLIERARGWNPHESLDKPEVVPLELSLIHEEPPPPELDRTAIGHRLLGFGVLSLLFLGFWLLLSSIKT